MSTIDKSKKIRAVVNYNYDMGTIPSQPEKPSALLVSPGDPIGATETKRKKKGKKGKDYASPLHAQAEGYQEEMERSDVDKAIAREESPFGDRRVSGPVLDGHQKPSTGDHGAGRGRNANVAYAHQDLRQSNTDFREVASRLSTLRTNTSAFIGQAAFGGEFSATDRPRGAPGDNVRVQCFDPRDEAGRYTGVRDPVSSGPSSSRPEYHQHRNSATPDNGSHSTSQATSRHPYSSKSIKDIMRDNAIEAIRKAGR